MLTEKQIKNREACKRWRDKNKIREKERQRKYIEENRDQINERQRLYRMNNKDKVKEFNSRAYRKRSTEGSMLEGARARAKQKGLDFNLELSDIIVPDCCPILGIPLERSKTRSPCDSSPSLDRVDTTLGYIKGNVHVISHKANRLKGHLSISELEKLLEYCYKSVKASA